MRDPRSINFILLFCAAYVPLSVIYVLLPLPHGWAVLSSATVPALMLAARFFQSSLFVDVQLGEKLGNLRDYQVFTRSVPKYRYHDLHAAAARFAEKNGLVEFSTQHSLGLGEILNRTFLGEHDRQVKKPTAASRPCSADRMAFVPEDAFWVGKGPNAPVGIVRARMLQQYQGATAVLEVAATQAQDPSSVIEEIVAMATENSVYKGQLIELEFQGQSYDEFEGVVQGQTMDVRFLGSSEIRDEDIVLDDDVRAVLERNVIDFHVNRSALKRIGLPGKRGLLFYGPPGTGKTYTSKYLAGKLEGVTTIVVAGSTLTHVKAVCNAARTLQPALVVMEDVDLVFSSRDANLAGAYLGDLMDELDGFGSDEEIVYILTTNAIERVEPAIKDRPGRISQCVYFGPPSRALRHQYFERLLAPYKANTVNLGEIVEQTDGCTQAFMKELVFRAAQTRLSQMDLSERDEMTSELLPIVDADVAAAMAEMRSGAGRVGESIIGFRVEPEHLRSS